MPDQKNVFISHVHEDDDLVPKLKGLLARAGMDVRDGSITSDKPNEARNEDYIKQSILAPRIQWASSLVVLISRDTAESWWVDWEINYAAQKGKVIVGVFTQGATESDIPDALQRCGDAAIVRWEGERLVDAINGGIREWDDPTSGKARSPDWEIKRYSCA